MIRRTFNEIWFVLCMFMLALLAGCMCDDCYGEADDDDVDERAVASLKKAYTICVGVENGFAGKCPGSKRDVITAKGMLTKYSKKIVSLTDKQATRAAVIAQLQEGIKYELCIFYYSGHGGSMVAYNDKTEADGRDEFLCLYDTSLMDNDIWNIISRSKGRVMLIFDCCHSGTMFRAPIAFRRPMSKLCATTHASGNINMLCWSGCGDSEYSYGSSAGGELTNAIRRQYKKSLSYTSMWNHIESDSRLRKHEIVHSTLIGSGFSDKKVFQ